MGTGICHKKAADEEEIDNHIGSGMDCAVVPLKRYRDYSLVQSVDFFYPVLDDPIVMGKIAFANVVSDVHAIGVTNIDNLNMLISAPTELNEFERDMIIQKIIQGFCESANEVQCIVTIQSITFNPWCIIGGIATSVCSREQIIMPNNARDGDVIILTKPLGTNLATSALNWMQEKSENYYKIVSYLTDYEIERTFEIAVKSMTKLNKFGALLMHKYGAHAATDVSGFGLLGHAKNLALFQKDVLRFYIHTLPIIVNVIKISEIVGQASKLKDGKEMETSGGLLICLPPESAVAFCNDYKSITKTEYAWIIGHISRGVKREAIIKDPPGFIEIC